MSLDLSFKENFVDGEMPETELYEVGNAVRNICFALENGQRIFFNYAYLVSVELSMNAEIHRLKVSFTSQEITLLGYNLHGLFEQLMNHRPKIIVAKNIRYVTETDVSIGVVTEIIKDK